MQLTQSQIADMNDRDPNEIDTVIIHHSVADKTLDISQIAAMEQASQGFISVGYNAYLKCVDVANDEWVVQEGRPLDKVPAAALGYNSRSYDICIGGNYHPGGAPFLDNVSQNALKLVIDIVCDLQGKRLNNAKARNLKYLGGHRDVATWSSVLAAENLTPSDVSTACPGDLLYARLHDLRVATGLATHPA